MVVFKSVHRLIKLADYSCVAFACQVVQDECWQLIVKVGHSFTLILVVWFNGIIVTKKRDGWKLNFSLGHKRQKSS